MQRTFLRNERKNKDMFIREVAREIGISRNYYGQIESGVKDPSLKVACKLEKFFNIPVCTLLRRDGDDD